jgi:hypothetical protein
LLVNEARQYTGEILAVKDLFDCGLGELILQNTMFEHHRKPLLPKSEYYKRLFKNIFAAFLMAGNALGLGVLGYHYFAQLSWIDAFLNASMILTGMGPMNPIVSLSGKLFAAFYALFSGIIFLSSILVVMAPIVHRFLHKFHLEDEGGG